MTDWWCCICGEEGGGGGGGVFMECCPGLEIPTTLNVALEANDCHCNFGGTGTLTYDGSYWWVGTVTTGCGDVVVRFACMSGGTMWEWELSCSGDSGGPQGFSMISGDCDEPFATSVQIYGINGICTCDADDVVDVRVWE